MEGERFEKRKFAWPRIHPSSLVHRRAKTICGRVKIIAASWSLIEAVGSRNTEPISSWGTKSVRSGGTEAVGSRRPKSIGTGCTEAISPRSTKSIGAQTTVISVDAIIGKGLIRRGHSRAGNSGSGARRNGSCGRNHRVGVWHCAHAHRRRRHPAADGRRSQGRRNRAAIWNRHISIRANQGWSLRRLAAAAGGCHDGTHDQK